MLPCATPRSCSSWMLVATHSSVAMICTSEGAARLIQSRSDCIGRRGERRRRGDGSERGRTQPHATESGSPVYAPLAMPERRARNRPAFGCWNVVRAAHWHSVCTCTPPVMQRATQQHCMLACARPPVARPGEQKYALTSACSNTINGDRVVSQLDTASVSCRAYTSMGGTSVLAMSGSSRSVSSRSKSSVSK